MTLNKSFSEVKCEPTALAEQIAAATGIEVPPDYVTFRASIGGTRLEGAQPYLLLHPANPKVELAEFAFFHDYERILHHQKRLLESPEDLEYKKQLEKSIMRIGSCEEQVEIFMGYGKDNLNQVYVYIVEEDILEMVGSLENLINNHLVAYPEE